MTMRRVGAAASALALALATCVSGPALATLPSPAVTVVGDSVAAGWALPSPGQAWPSRLADRLWGQDHTRLTVDAVGGRCLVAAGCVGSTVVQDWPAILAGGPATIIVAAGENDVGRIPATTIEAAITQLVDTGRAAGARVLVATIPPRESSQWPTWWGWGPTMLAVNAWVRATYGSDVLDFYTALVAPNGWMRPEVGSGDGVHPNRYGHLDLSDTVPVSAIR